MSVDRIDRGIGILATRIGRRFVLLFLGCAFVPLVVFAWLAANQVSRELSQTADASLRDAAKSDGMGIAAHLSQLTSDLALIQTLLTLESHEEHVLDIAERLGRHFTGVWSAGPDRARTLFGERQPPACAWTPAQLAHLGQGKALLVTAGQDGAMLLVRATDPKRPAAGWVCASIRPEWIWDPEELADEGARVVVLDGERRPLFHNFGRVPDLSPVWEAQRRRPTSGEVSLVVDGVEHFGRYWNAFLRPQYGQDLWVVVSRPRAEVFAVERDFRIWFASVALGALLSVFVVSLVQMRRTLRPIVQLGEATRRVASGDYTVGAEVHGSDEFGELGRSFDRMTTQLAEQTARREATERQLIASRDDALAAARAKAEFVTNVSHEMRTPMTEMLSATEILGTLDDSDAATRAEFVAIAQHGAKRLARIVDDTLALGDSSPWPMAPTDVTVALRRALGALPGEVAARTVLSVPGDLPTVLGVPERLADVFGRLLDNAAKFSPDDQPIQVVAVAHDGIVEVAVRDRGIGIAAVDLARIFEPFGQVGRDQLTEKAPGVGLGLSIVRHVVGRCGGRVEVDSGPGRGSTFRVLLPVLVQSTATQTAPSRPVCQPVSTEPASAGLAASPAGAHPAPR